MAICLTFVPEVPQKNGGEASASPPVHFQFRRRRIRGSRCPKVTNLSNFVLACSAIQSGWYRYCFRPFWSLPVAWICPSFREQIHTSVQAGGIARFLMPGDQRMGWLMTIALGIVGSFAGGALSTLIFRSSSFAGSPPTSK